MLGSESELSDIPDRPTFTAPQNLSSTSPPPHQNGVAEEESELSDNEDIEMGSDDGEFEVDSQPPENHVSYDDQSSSQESRRPPKRKAVGIEDDEHIMKNPDLYGIRRSVRTMPHKLLALHAYCHQGRPRHNQTIVCFITTSW